MKRYILKIWRQNKDNFCADMFEDVFGKYVLHSEAQERIDALTAERDALLKERNDALRQEPIAFGSKCHATGKWGYIWHDESDVAGWVNLQHMSRDDCTYSKPISLFPKSMPPAIPEGYVIVPVDPTEEMIDDGCEMLRDCDLDMATFTSASLCYKAMIAASQKGGA